MQYEYVFRVANHEAERLAPVNLAAAGFLERQHLQEWIINNSEVLGEDALIVTSEFDRWQTSTGGLRKDRLDVLAIDSGGQLILAELKRDSADRDVDLQALKYAAMVSRFDEEALVDAHRRFLSSRSASPVSQDRARAAIEGHIDGPIDPEAWAQPRIVLIANSFPDTVTNTVVWLSEAGLDLILLRYQMYRTEGDPLLVVSQIYPVPEAEEFLLSPRREEVKQAKERVRDRRRSKDVVKVLVGLGEPAPGTQLHLVATGIREDLRDELDEWLAADPTRGQAEWTGDVTAPLRWASTGEAGKPSTFATRILEEATGERRSIAGPRWWCTPDGESLSDIARRHGAGDRGTRDWSDLHAVLAQLPSGKWTTYGDLAALIGTHANPLGQHLASCPDCVNAYRVMRHDGSVADGFQWTDPTDTRTAREILEAEGIAFDDSGRAGSALRLSTSELRKLAPQS